MGQLLQEVTDALATEDMEKAELLNITFAVVFTLKAGPKEHQILKVKTENLEKRRLSLG